MIDRQLNMSGDSLTSLPKLEDSHNCEEQLNVRKQGRFLNQYNVLSTSASPEASSSSYNVVQRVPRLLFSVQKEKNFVVLFVF